MKKKGFTLIELLAVIIVLAIIALIATPIIMRVIENSKKGAAERSAENYIHAVETAVLAERTNGNTINDGTYGIKENGNLCPNNAASCSASEEIKIDMSGKKPSSGSVVISNGNVVASGENNTTTTLAIGDYTVTINENGSATATKASGSSEQTLTRYYSWTTLLGNISDGLPSDADTDLSNINTRGTPFYLAFDLVDGETIDAAYVCFKTNDNDAPYCIKGGDGGAAFESNQSILDEAFPGICNLDGDNYSCSADDLAAWVGLDGYVFAHLGIYGCSVDSSGEFECVVGGSNN